MTVWSIQPVYLFEKLREQGVLHCDPNSKDFWGLECENFRVAYDWLVDQMKFRIGMPPDGVEYPFWAWALIDGVGKKPDLRRSQFNGCIGENVVLELNIPDADLLLSDEDNWYYVLNKWYLHDLKSEEEKWEEKDAWFNSLPPNEKDVIRRKSWECIFDKDDENNDWESVQATFWELRLEQVKSVRRFTGRGKII